VSYPFLKGHGTENDFVLLPDADGTVHGDLSAERVRALTDRRAGLGGDGVLRVIRTSSYAGPDRDLLAGSDAEWFMDYRNADGSIAEMCGNGTRVFAEHLRSIGACGDTVTIATRAGDRTLRADGDAWTVDLGGARLLGWVQVGVGEHAWKARHVDMGNPHAVAFVDAAHLDSLDLSAPPLYDAADYPRGVNVELVVREAPDHLRLRVHERGVGETRSCGTGIAAAAIAAMDDDGVGTGAASYVVDVPGGRLTVTRTAAGGVLLTGPAVLVAEGTTDL
jgi:diaminopimelate epimerase